MSTMPLSFVGLGLLFAGMALAIVTLSGGLCSREVPHLLPGKAASFHFHLVSLWFPNQTPPFSGGDPLERGHATGCWSAPLQFLRVAGVHPAILEGCWSAPLRVAPLQSLRVAGVHPCNS